MDHMQMMFGFEETGFEEATKKSEKAKQTYGNASSKQELLRHHKIVLTT